MDTIRQGRDLAALAGLLADETRATFCMALPAGRAWTAGELARHAGVAASTASEHLTRLVAGGILREHRQGRHRYVALADAGVAQQLRAPPASPMRGGRRCWRPCLLASSRSRSGRARCAPSAARPRSRAHARATTT